MSASATGLDRQTLEALDWPALTEHLATLARTPQARQRALALLPAVERDEVETLLAETAEAQMLVSSGEEPRLGGIEDIESAVAACARGEALDLDALRAVAGTVEVLASLARELCQRADDVPALAALAGRIALAQELCAALASAFDERGGLSERTYPVLGELRRKIESLDRQVRNVLDELLASGGLDEVLQDRYVTVRSDRLVLPIKAQAKGLGLGIVHDASRSGQTVYLEPQQVVSLNNERRLAEAELAREQARICRELSALIGRHAQSIERGLEAAVAIDLALARALLAAKLDARRPVLVADPVVELRQARHPLLVLQGADVVANDLALNTEHPVLVVTGPNAGGKTVALKTIGLCALLVRAGCFVPAAEGSRVGILSPILADIGDRQSVADGLSSFSGHLRNLREMIERAAFGCLLLLDELASGTDPSQGGALARAVIEQLADAGARVVVTTHYAQVKGMGVADGRVVVLGMEYREGRPTYRAVPGMAGESHAFEAALAAGLGDGLVERARQLMDQGERALGEALAALERERGRAEQLAAEAERLRSEVASREHRLAAREQLIARRSRELEREAAAEFVSVAKRAEQQVARIVAQLQRSPSQREAARARAAIQRIREEIKQRVEPAAPASPEAPVIGDRVRIPRLGATGVVTGTKDGELEVQSGRLTVRVAPDDVELAGGGRSPAVGDRAQRAAGTGGGMGGSAAPAELQPHDLVRLERNTLDLRGCRVAEALHRLEEFLDRALLDGLDGVFVLHGHGTDALKKAIRGALAASPYVADFAPGDEMQGGDGVTAVVLRG